MTKRDGRVLGDSDIICPDLVPRYWSLDCCIPASTGAPTLWMRSLRTLLSCEARSTSTSFEVVALEAHSARPSQSRYFSRSALSHLTHWSHSALCESLRIVYRLWTEAHRRCRCLLPCWSCALLLLRCKALQRPQANLSTASAFHSCRKVSGPHVSDKSQQQARLLHDQVHLAFASSFLAALVDGRGSFGKNRSPSAVTARRPRVLTFLILRA